MEIRPGGRKLRFEKLLPAVAQVHGCGVINLTAAGRQRVWAKPRAQLAYLARDWCAMKAIEIARRLHRDASMVSRLCANYEVARVHHRYLLASAAERPSSSQPRPCRPQSILSGNSQVQFAKNLQYLGGRGVRVRRPAGIAGSRHDRR